MRKLVALTSLPLDGSVQAPGDPVKDAGGGTVSAVFEPLEARNAPAVIMAINDKPSGETRTGTFA